MKNEHAVLRLCQELEVSASGYYDWQFRRSCPGLRAAQDQTLKQENTTSRNTYGSPRIVMELRKSGARHGRNRVARHETGGNVRAPEGALPRSDHR